MKIEYTCIICGKTVTKTRSPGNLKTLPKFCSQKCHGIYIHQKAPGKTMNYKGICKNCGNEFETYCSPSRHTPKFCSIKCIGESQKGINNPAYNGGRYTDSNGYVIIYMPDHPHSGAKKTILEHRYIMECKIGRYLTDLEVVHHIDGNKSNNEPDNLMLFNNQTEHGKYHTQLRNTCKRSSSNR